MEVKTIVRIKQICSLITFGKVSWELLPAVNSTNIESYMGYMVITLGVGFIWNKRLYDELCEQQAKAFVSYKVYETIAMIWSVFFFIIIMTHAAK